MKHQTATTCLLVSTASSIVAMQSSRAKVVNLELLRWQVVPIGWEARLSVVSACRCGPKKVACGTSSLIDFVERHVRVATQHDAE
jgi:hypothetical protein